MAKGSSLYLLLLESRQYTVEAVSKQVNSVLWILEVVPVCVGLKGDVMPKAGNRAGKSQRCKLCLDSMAEVYTDLSVETCGGGYFFLLTPHVFLAY